MSAPWFRVPAFLAKELCGDHKATDAEAWVELLGLWHLGHDVSACELQRRLQWSKQKTLEFMPKVARWANENGAAVPPRWTNCKTDRAPDRKPTGLLTGPIQVEAGKPDNDRPVSDRATDRFPTAANSSAVEETQTQKRQEEKRERARATPPPEPSPLMALLMGAGMAGGYAAAAARALADAGVTDPTAATDLDEFDLGRIVGPARKALVIKAFRGAGWVPPKERRAAPAMPRPVVITEDGARVDPAGPVRPLSKSEAMIEALQQLKREGGRDGQRIRNH